MEVIIGTLSNSSHIKKMLEDPQQRHKVLANQELADILVQQATLMSGLTCVEVEDDLAAFIDAECRSGETTSTYRRLQEHLYRCPQCYEEYSLAQAITEAQRIGQLPSWPGSTSAPPKRRRK